MLLILNESTERMLHQQNGKPEIHYTNVYNAFKFWNQRGCFDKIFEASVARLFKAGMLNTVIVHGDGTSTTAKKGAII